MVKNETRLLEEATADSWIHFKEVFAAVCGRNDLDYLENFKKDYTLRKSRLFKLFGHKTMLTTSIDDVISDEELGRLIVKFLTELKSVSINIDIIGDFLTALSEKSITTNKLIEYDVNVLKHDFDLKAQVGTKVSKLMLKLLMLNGVSSKHCDTIGQIYSRYLSQFKAKGTVVVSIDPLDLLLASEHGIRSCHSLDGGYRAGNLCYLLDEVTAVAYYYRSKENFCKYGITIPSLPKKIWRQLIFIDIDYKSAVLQRQYPAENELASKEARRLVATALATYHDVTADWTIRRNPAEDHYTIEKENNLFHLDDSVAVIKLKDGGTAPNLIVGETPYCLVCGSNNLDQSDSLLCSYCSGSRCYECGCDICDAHYVNGRHYCDNCFNENYTYCEYCNTVIHINDAYYADDKPYCRDCFNENHTHCEYCDTVVHIDDAHYVDSEPYCEDCFNENYTYCEYCDTVVHMDDAHYAGGGFYCKDCFDENYTHCEYCNTVVNIDDAHYVDDKPYCGDCYNDLYKKEVV